MKMHMKEGGGKGKTYFFLYLTDRGWPQRSRQATAVPSSLRQGLIVMTTLQWRIDKRFLDRGKSERTRDRGKQSVLLGDPPVCVCLSVCPP